MFLSFSLSLPQQKIIAIYSFLTLYQTFLRELSACSTFTFQIRSYLKRNWEHVSCPKTLRTSNFSSQNPLNHGSSHCCTGIPPGSTLQQWITHLFSKSTYCTLIHTLYPAQPCTSRRIRIDTFLLLEEEFLLPSQAAHTSMHTMNIRGWWALPKVQGGVREGDWLEKNK